MKYAEQKRLDTPYHIENLLEREPMTAIILAAGYVSAAKNAEDENKLRVLTQSKCLNADRG